MELSFTFTGLALDALGVCLLAYEWWSNHRTPFGKYAPHFGALQTGDHISAELLPDAVVAANAVLLAGAIGDNVFRRGLVIVGVVCLLTGFGFQAMGAFLSAA